MAVKALVEGTHVQDGRLLWAHNPLYPATLHPLDKKRTLLLFGDDSILGGQRLGTDLVLYPGAFPRSLPTLATDTLLTLFSPKTWKRPIHFPIHQAQAVRMLDSQVAFLPSWAQASLFPQALLPSLLAFLWALAVRFQHATQRPDPFTLSLVGANAGRTRLEGPLVWISLPSTPDTQPWRALMGSLIGQWLAHHLGPSFRLACIHQYPPGQAGVLAQVSWPHHPISGHATLQALALLEEWLPSCSVPTS
jgi:hypothetical protein